MALGLEFLADKISRSFCAISKKALAMSYSFHSHHKQASKRNISQGFLALYEQDRGLARGRWVFHSRKIVRTGGETRPAAVFPVPGSRRADFSGLPFNIFLYKRIKINYY
jgi:hypothetical protein